MTSGAAFFEQNMSYNAIFYIENLKKLSLVSLFFQILKKKNEKLKNTGNIQTRK